MILHLSTKFHSNGTTHGKVMSSYRFSVFENRGQELEIYPSLRFYWQHSFSNVRVYLHAKFQ